MIPFNKSSVASLEAEYVLDCLKRNRLSGDGYYTKRVYKQFNERFSLKNMLLTTSGTDALELASILAKLESGDEVIVPSFTFSSTVNAFLLRGAKPIFCDIRSDTFNMDETKIEALITPRTKAIYTVDYAGIPCEMDTINAIAKKHHLTVIQDAAQSVGSTYKGQYTGTLAEFTCFSFHETKNFAMGEGGALIVRDDSDYVRGEIVREKGTNRREVLLGLVDKYTWHDIGSSFLPSDILAAVLSAQMDRYEEIYSKRMTVWNCYHQHMSELDADNKLQCSYVPPEIEHNAHMYNIALDSEQTRSDLIDHLKSDGISAYICYVPLHSSPYGRKLGNKPEDCPVTEDYGHRILRLPLYADMSLEDAEHVSQSIKKFFLRSHLA